MTDNDEELKKWHKFNSWGAFEDMTEEEQQSAMNACLGYMLRQLKRGRVPRAELIQKTMTGENPIPPCKHINCTVDFEHVH